MEGKIALLDTPRKASLQLRSTSLRAALKDFERNHSTTHNGRKPGKDDIKADAEIAQKYKEYNKIRDVLAGKANVSVLDAPSPTKVKKSHILPKSTAKISPPKQHYASTPRAKRLRPDDIDPYDPPNSVTPRRTVSAIGPTPQRDGQVLGIFDLLSNQGSGRSIHATPSNRKRKIASMLDFDEDIENQAVVAQTPSQRSEKKHGDLLDHLSRTPVSQPRMSRHKHSRTPASDSKRFMLSQFFATPSAVRYASVAGPQIESGSQPRVTASMPLRDHVLGTPITKSRSGSKALNSHTFDATPAYLRRTHSFKDRLLSISEKQSAENSSDEDHTSPSSVHTRPKRTTTRQAKFMPKPLSQIAAEMRQREEAQHDDDLDAMREMENDDVDILVGDSQVTTVVAVEQTEQPPARIWKKKGQKRSTKRVIMRPSRVKPTEQLPPPSEAEHDEDIEDQALLELADQQGSSEDELHTLTQPDDDASDDEFNDPNPSKPKNKQKHSKGNSETAVKSLGRPPKAASKGGEGKKKDTFNANATAHMNFRSLKIKNKNSKAKGRGRGRFGRR